MDLGCVTACHSVRNETQGQKLPELPLMSIQPPILPSVQGNNQRGPRWAYQHFDQLSLIGSLLSWRQDIRHCVERTNKECWKLRTNVDPHHSSFCFHWICSLYVPCLSGLVNLLMNLSSTNSLVLTATLKLQHGSSGSIPSLQQWMPSSSVWPAAGASKVQNQVIQESFVNNKTIGQVNS